MCPNPQDQPRGPDLSFLRVRLAASTTAHCILGFGLGKVLGIVLGLALALPPVTAHILDLALGFSLGVSLGRIPLRRAGQGRMLSTRQVLVAGGLAIVVMEFTEALVEVNAPGVMSSGLSSPLFWRALILVLFAGFVASFPVNYWLIGVGVRDQQG